MRLEDLQHRDDVPHDVQEAIAEHLAGQRRDRQARDERAAWFRQIAETHFEAVGVHEDGVLIDANDQFIMLFGYPREELIGKQVIPLTAAPESREKLRAQVASRAPGPYEALGLKRDGTEFPIEIRAREIEYCGRRVRAGVIRDLSETKRSEEALRASEERFRLAAQSTADLIYEWDVENDRLDWFGDIDSALGFEAGTFPRTLGAWLERIHPQDRERLDEAAEIRREGREPIREEYRVRHQDGSWRHWVDHGVPLLDGEGRPRKWVGACNDVTAQRVAEETRAEKEALWRSLTDSSPDHIMLLDRDLNVRFINHTVPDLTRAEVIGRPIQDFLSADQREPSRRALRRALETGEIQEYETYYFPREGVRHHFSTRVGPVVEGGRVVGLILNARDVTERHQVEEELARHREQLEELVVARTAELLSLNAKLRREVEEREQVERALVESEGRYRSYVSLAPDGVFVADASGRYVDVNEAACRMMGYSREELLELSVPDLADEDPGGNGPESFATLRRTGRYSAEVRLRRRDGEWIVAALDAVRLSEDRFMAFCKDVTARKKAEADVHRLHAAIEQSTQGIAIIDLEGHVLQVNAASARMLGYDPEEIEGQHVAMLHDEDQIPLVKRAMEECRREGYWKGEVRFRRRDGTQFPGFMYNSVLVDEQGQPSGLIGTVNDNTERRRAEEDLRSLTGRLLAVREDERSAISREIHDELGQALTGAKLDLAWIQGRLRKDQGPLEERSRAAISLLDQSLEVVRDISTRLRPAVLDDLGLEAALEWQTRDFARRTGIECQLDVDVNDAELAAERATAIFRIAQETLTNVARHAQARSVKLGLEQQGDQLLLEVVDDGQGIAEAEIDSPRSLGLIGMRERAAALGGQLEIRGLAEGGTLVRLMLAPAGPAESREAR